ncbi:MAG TPA: 30S ribosomal protein S12 methylthiotransferase RimO [Anaerolineae bacterium]|nr:30S ribosomal protein S12 methylthiotransferase RimO [Anaerolineae bacterium]
MRFYLLSLGCPKNLVESEGMRELLLAAGHQPASEPGQADILVVNTCGFIDIAREESLEALRELAEDKRPGQYLVAAGCMAERYGSAMADMAPALDGILGTRRWTDINTLVAALTADDKRDVPCQLPQPDPERTPVHPLPRRCPGLATAYVKIAEGCDAPCAFCAIPQIKGPFRSKPREAVLSEVHELVRQGVKEIIFIAQDTTAYGMDWGDDNALPALIESILADVPSLPWLRLMYTYPQRITPRLAETMASHSQVLHYLDLPLQHAHPSVLRRMNRPHEVSRIRSVIADLRQLMPDIALRTSFIVGYPGETEQEFQTLLDFMSEIAFDRVGIFAYSPEEGTRAALLPGQTPDEVKGQRYERAMALQQGISLEKNKQLIGQRLEILIEGAGDGISVGRSYRDAPEVDGMVVVQEELPVNEFASVHITEALEYDLVGRPE